MQTTIILFVEYLPSEISTVLLNMALACVYYFQMRFNMQNKLTRFPLT